MKLPKIVAAMCFLVVVTLLISKSAEASRQQYTLRQITFENSPIRPDGLRKLIPMKDGETFDPELLRLGLEQVQYVYEQYSYIRMKYKQEWVPDDANGSMSVIIWVEAGRPFYIKSVDVLGAKGRNLRERLAHYSIERGKLYNRGLAEEFFRKYAPSSLATVVPQSRIKLEADDAGTVAVTFDFREPSEQR